MLKDTACKGCIRFPQTVLKVQIGSLENFKFLSEFGSKWLYNRKSEGPKIDPTELSQVQTIQV